MLHRSIAIFAVLMAFCNTGWAQGSEEPYVEVINVAGTVEALIAPDENWGGLKEDAILHSEDSVKTSGDSYAEIAFDEDKIVRIEPNSYVTILLQGDEKIELVSGAVYAAVKKLPPKSSFEIRTPIAMSGARGTDWLTKIDGSDMVIESYDGMPFVRTMNMDGTFAREETRIGPGYQTSVTRFGPPAKFTKIPQQSMENWKNWKTDLAPRVQKAAMVRKQKGGKLGGDINPKLKEGKLQNNLGRKRPDAMAAAADRNGRTGYLKQGSSSALQMQNKSAQLKAPTRIGGVKPDSSGNTSAGNVSGKRKTPPKIKCCPPNVLKPTSSKGQTASRAGSVSKISSR